MTYRCWEHYAESISGAKCVLNWLRGNLVNLRVFEGMAIGTPLVTTRNPDMLAIYGLQEYEHYSGYWGIPEMLEQIQWVVDHLTEALDMAERARAYVLAHHTYHHRALELLEWLCG